MIPAGMFVEIVLVGVMLLLALSPLVLALYPALITTLKTIRSKENSVVISLVVLVVAYPTGILGNRFSDDLFGEAIDLAHLQLKFLGGKWDKQMLLKEVKRKAEDPEGQAWRELLRGLAEELFSLELEFEDDLAVSPIPDDLRQRFINNGTSISKNASVQGDSPQWQITDEDRGIYIVRREGDQLNTYDAKKVKTHLYKVAEARVLQKGDAIRSWLDRHKSFVRILRGAAFSCVVFALAVLVSLIVSNQRKLVLSMLGLELGLTIALIFIVTLIAWRIETYNYQNRVVLMFLKGNL